MGLRLILPDTKFFKSYRRALEELRDVSSSPEHFQLLIDNFPDFVVATMAKEATAIPRQRTYWLVSDDDYLGTVNIREEPSARFSNIKSNIYYEIRPSQRRRGYGTMALSLAVEEARDLGLSHLTLSCDSDNEASRKIIEKAKATLVRAEHVPDRAEPVLIYELDIEQASRNLAA